MIIHSLRAQNLNFPEYQRTYNLLIAIWVPATECAPTAASGSRDEWLSASNACMKKPQSTWLELWLGMNVARHDELWT